MPADNQGSGERPRCEHFILAHGVVAQVEYCAACAIFHLNIDSLSVRFRPTALRDLRDTLTAALDAYEQARRLAEERFAPGPRDGMH